MRRHHLTPYLVGALAWMLVGVTAAQAASAPPPAAPTPQLADRLHDRISRGVLKAAETIDAFFYNPQTEIEENRTTFRINLGLFVEREERARLSSGTGLKLILPGFQNRLHLVMAGDPDDDDKVLGEAIDEAPDPQLAVTDEADGVTASLRYFVLDDIKRNLSFTAGVRIRDGNLVGFPEARYRRLFDLGDGATAFRFQERVVWFTDDGWRESTRIDMDVLLRPRLLWRSSLEGIWAEEVSGYRYNLIQAIFQTLSPRAALRYEWVNAFNVCTEDQLDEILFKIRYRQSFWRPWLFFEIAPQLTFPEPDEFVATPGILFRLEAIFGHRPKATAVR
ncbi:MAG: hypothetical protein QNJ22_02000 [Desulfosarcinaceae bacterium]|nr:hypothetical protein [Desulfosarcinaceae bacterium]